MLTEVPGLYITVSEGAHGAAPARPSDGDRDALEARGRKVVLHFPLHRSTGLGDGKGAMIRICPPAATELYMPLRADVMLFMLVPCRDATARMPTVKSRSAIITSIRVMPPWHRRPPVGMLLMACLQYG